MSLNCKHSEENEAFRNKLYEHPEYETNFRNKLYVGASREISQSRRSHVASVLSSDNSPAPARTDRTQRSPFTQTFISDKLCSWQR